MLSIFFLLFHFKPAPCSDAIDGSHENFWILLAIKLKRFWFIWEKRKYALLTNTRWQLGVITAYCQFQKLFCNIMKNRLIVGTNLLWLYSQTCINWTSLGPTYVLAIDRCLNYTGYIIKISYIETLFHDRLKQNSSLFKVRLRDVWL